MTLHLGTADQPLDLPDDAATEAMAILGQRGAGKSNALVVLAEELYAAGVPWVAVDPKGDWWGIRSGVDGASPGLPVPIFGGFRGDIPIEPTAAAGRYLADLIFDTNLTCVLDVSTFSLGERARFLAPFFDTLYRRHHADPTVRHLLLEEAHVYIPQVVDREEGRLKEAAARCVLLGRTWGLGATVATQRSAKISKDVLTQVGVLFAMWTSGTQDRAAIKEWVKEHGTPDDLVASLPSLPKGTAWLWAPGVLGRVEQVTFRRRRTFDSAATPKVGQKARPPATLADVDLATVKDAMAELIAKAEADDPAALRRRIAQLERDLAAARAVTGLAPDLVKLLTAKADGVTDAYGRVTAAVGELDVSVDMLRAAVRTSTRPRPAPPGPSPAVPDPVPAQPAAQRAGTSDLRRRPRKAAAVGELVDQATAALDTGVWDAMLKHEQTLFATLARHRAGLNRLQLALLSCYSFKSSSVKNGIGALRRMGLVTPAHVEPIALTGAGVILADGLNLPTLPAGAALYAYWTERLKPHEAAVLRVLVDAWPDEMDREHIATVTGYRDTSSTIKNALGRLRTLGLVDGWSASDEFVGAIRQ